MNRAEYKMKSWLAKLNRRGDLFIQAQMRSG